MCEEVCTVESFFGVCVSEGKREGERDRVERRPFK